VTTIQTREATTGNDDPTEEIVYHGKEKVVDEDKASLKEDDADGKKKRHYANVLKPSHVG
jgi:hypothetical protein